MSLLNKIILEKKSKYNGDLRVVKTLGMGTYIQSNGLTQSGGIVETIWKQTLRKINNLQLIINNCLILGLGGGTVAKLIARKYPAAKLTGIEMDPIMVELGKKYLELNKIKIDIITQDAFSYFNNHQLPVNSYDLIIVDLYNGDQFPKKLESEKSIEIIKSLLSKEGIVVFNRLYYGEKRPDSVKFGNSLKKYFKNIKWFYPEANLMFICRK